MGDSAQSYQALEAESLFVAGGFQTIA